jgi:hypothetical protein
LEGRLSPPETSKAAVGSASSPLAVSEAVARDLCDLGALEVICDRLRRRRHQPTPIDLKLPPTSTTPKSSLATWEPTMTTTTESPIDSIGDALEQLGFRARPRPTRTPGRARLHHQGENVLLPGTTGPRRLSVSSPQPARSHHRVRYRGSADHLHQAHGAGVRLLLPARHGMSSLITRSIRFLANTRIRRSLGRGAGSASSSAMSRSSDRTISLNPSI